MKTQKLGLLPTLIVILGVLGLAILIGVIALMMVVRSGIRHNPQQSRLPMRQATGSLVRIALRQKGFALTPPAENAE